MQPPFAVKVMSPDILHKSDAGGVKIGLRRREGRAGDHAQWPAAPQIKAARVDGFLVEEMAPAGAGSGRRRRARPAISARW